MSGSLSTRCGRRLGRLRRRLRDLLLVVPFGMLGVIVADILADPERPGPATWWAVAAAGAAIALYLAFPGRE